MRPTPVISLDVRFGPSREPGWHDVRASNKQTYGYHYTGGDDGAGGIETTVGKGPVEGLVRLVAEKRYEISGCNFADDPEGQLDWQGKSPNVLAIFDKNTAVLSAKYTVFVTDTDNANCTIPCDPMITNVPPAHF